MIPLGVLASAHAPASGGGGLVAAFLQSATQTTAAATFTFASQNIGAAAADRNVVVIVAARKASPSPTVNSVTIGGVSATIDVTDPSTAGSRMVIARAVVPSGTTADVVVALSTSTNRCGIGLWRIAGTIGSVDTDAAYDITGNNSVTVDAAAGGFTVAGALANSVLTASWGGGGFTERYDDPFVSEQTGADSDATGTLTPTCAWSSPGANIMAAASYAPA